MRQRADGKWHGWVTMGVKDDGTPGRRHREGESEAEVTAKVQKLEKQRDSGKIDKAGTKVPTVAQWIRTYLDEIVPMRVSRLPLDSTYRPKAEWWIIPRLCAHRLDRLRPDHLDAFYATACRKNCTKHGGVCPKFCAADCAKHAPSCPDRVGGWTFTKPKGRGKRSIALPPPLIVLLKLHKDAQRLEREAAGDRWQAWDLVWCTPDGNPIDAGDDWKQLLQLAEIDKDARVHDARHTAATLLLEQGVDIRVIQAVLGHSQLTTIQRYTHITETPAIEAAGRMGRALWDA